MLRDSLIQVWPVPDPQWGKERASPKNHFLSGHAEMSRSSLAAVPSNVVSFLWNHVSPSPTWHACQFQSFVLFDRFFGSHRSPSSQNPNGAGKQGTHNETFTAARGPNWGGLGTLWSPVVWPENSPLKKQKTALLFFANLKRLTKIGKGVCMTVEKSFYKSFFAPGGCLQLRFMRHHHFRWPLV